MTALAVVLAAAIGITTALLLSSCGSKNGSKNGNNDRIALPDYPSIPTVDTNIDLHAPWARNTASSPRILATSDDSVLLDIGKVNTDYWHTSELVSISRGTADERWRISMDKLAEGRALSDIQCIFQPKSNRWFCDATNRSKSAELFVVTISRDGTVESRQDIAGGRCETPIREGLDGDILCQQRKSRAEGSSSVIRIDSTTGTEKWRKTPAGTEIVTIALRGDKVIEHHRGASNSAMTTIVRDADTGSVITQFDRYVKSFNGVDFFGEAGDSGGAKTVIGYGLDGQEKWTIQLRKEDRIFDRVPLDGPIIVLNDASDSIFAVDAQTGKELWRTPREPWLTKWLADPFIDEPTLQWTNNNRRYFVTKDGLYALSLDNGSTAHITKDFSITDFSIPTTRSARFAYMLQNDVLSAYSQADGQRMWHTSLGDLVPDIRGQRAYVTHKPGLLTVATQDRIVILRPN